MNTIQTRAQRPRLRHGTYWPYLIPGGIGLVVVVIGPALANVGISLTRWNGVGAAEFTGLENYRALLTDSVFWQSFGNSIAVILAMAIVPTAVGLLVAALLYDYVAPRFGTHTSATMRAAIYLPQIIPIAVAGVLWGFMLQPSTGMVNTLLRQVGLESLARNWLGDPATAMPTVLVVLVWLQLGYTVVLFVAGMARIDPSLHEAAGLDGATWLQRFRHITVFELIPEISVVLLTTTVAALKVFAPIYVLTNGGPGTTTIVPSYFAYFHFFTTTKVGYGAAIATVLAIVLTVLAVVLLRVQARRDNS